MRTPLRAGIAVYNDGHHHAAHDAWEDRWLDLDDGTPDERLLHGLIQFTAAVYHARQRNWAGATGLAESAREYLADLDDDYRGCSLVPVRRYLATLAADPEVIERRRPQPLAHEGEQLALAELSPAESVVAARVLAAELGYDEEQLDRAGEYALTDLEAGRDDSRFLRLLLDFVQNVADREIVYQRLTHHVERRRSREADVSGLFE